ncbi:Golgin subfamily A member 7/ERF4 [Cordyceps fumosorosea ARSEF 2679]|uniref:Ras modification protein ERF4 n=1 Tax=Cordyceps fumosorosea (strain ARSEF 2679) TaxID=1081104 RepID=A0A167ZD34_CORFA|nr:Golgin subfamily A member 7/ERF4 [Cordyceps fumosorosea ARSEF 2679]OAA67365.1 Golgin subfamily A member 7/ERF4 [Cordyceps fumosorosea ARSEF 2679]
MTTNDAPIEGFTRDLERGRDDNTPRPSTVSASDGIGSALSSTNSSIMGDDIQGDLGEEWGARHPCYPHLNPHVPVNSVEFATTRIIRVRRDWLLHGDIAPAFSNLYPEILDPAGISEHEFRKVISKLNAELGETFNPYSGRNIVDSVMGAVTGWLWDDLGMTASKKKLVALEKWIEQWNAEMQKSMATEEGGLVAPKIISLRQTGYMTLDIRIPDPEIAPAPSTAGANESRTALTTEAVPALPV